MRTDPSKTQLKLLYPLSIWPSERSIYDSSRATKNLYGILHWRVLQKYNTMKVSNFRSNRSALSITLRVHLAVFLSASLFCACAERWHIRAEHAQRGSISELRMRREVVCLRWPFAALTTLRTQQQGKKYEGRSESKERFAIQRYLLIIGKTEYAGFITHIHLLLHIVTLDIEELVVPWHQFIYSLLVPEGRLAQRAQILWYCKCLVTIWYVTQVWTKDSSLVHGLLHTCNVPKQTVITICSFVA